LLLRGPGGPPAGVVGGGALRCRIFLLSGKNKTNTRGGVGGEKPLPGNRLTGRSAPGQKTRAGSGKHPGALASTKTRGGAGGTFPPTKSGELGRELLWARGGGGDPGQKNVDGYFYEYNRLWKFSRALDGGVVWGKWPRPQKNFFGNHRFARGGAAWGSFSQGRGGGGQGEAETGGTKGVFWGKKNFYCSNPQPGQHQPNGGRRSRARLSRAGVSVILFFHPTLGKGFPGCCLSYARQSGGPEPFAHQHFRGGNNPPVGEQTLFVSKTSTSFCGNFPPRAK